MVFHSSVFFFDQTATAKTAATTACERPVDESTSLRSSRKLATSKSEIGPDERPNWPPMLKLADSGKLRKTQKCNGPSFLI
jgi:hypothetical protein